MLSTWYDYKSIFILSLIFFIFLMTFFSATHQGNRKQTNSSSLLAKRDADSQYHNLNILNHIGAIGHIWDSLYWIPLTCPNLASMPGKKLGNEKCMNLWDKQIWVKTCFIPGSSWQVNYLLWVSLFALKGNSTHCFGEYYIFWPICVYWSYMLTHCILATLLGN